ncbi:MAG: phosphodiesterase [Wenzhouxiangella sp.]|nr:MAG: phosphodiesterase [Wenzhouxiangella sp.]
MQDIETIIAVQVAQSVFSLILAALLLSFLIAFKHRFLRHWSLSCLAMSLYLGTAALISNGLQDGSIDPNLRLGLSMFSLAMAYLHVLWLMMGAWEAVTERPVPTALNLALVVLMVAVGVGSALITPFAADAAAIRNLVRFSLLHAVTGIAFAVTAIMLWRSLRSSDMFSARLVPLAFSAYASYMLYISAISAWMTLNNEVLTHARYTGLVGFLLQILIGYSIVIWLLEIERRRSMRARSQAESAEQRLVHFRMHDQATGLPNRRQLQDQLATEVSSATPKRNRVAVLAIGVHRFKLISQALGWQETDRMVRKLAERLRQRLPADAILGRAGERDFLAILPNVGSRQRATEKCRQILSATSEPLVHHGQELFLALSGGMCLAPDDQIDAVALIDLAQQAQMEAVTSGQGLVVHRSRRVDTEPHNLIKLEQELRTGVRENQFQLYFQPLVSIRQRRVTGFETLLRWNHPKRGLLTPGTFLQQAVRLGILDELEDQILHQALSQLHEWQNDLAVPAVTVSINLSAQRFQQPDLAGKLAELCRSMKVDPNDLHLEITESTAMQDFEAGLNTISQLRELGCKICLDDFGTGYSSLSHLRRLQVDYVKLDRSFIVNLERDRHERDMTRAVVDLIHSLGMTVLAEGVETRQQLGYLIQCRVDVIQGFLMGKPRPAAAYRRALLEPQLLMREAVPEAQREPVQSD